MTRVPLKGEVAAFYDRFGSRQDDQAFYEDAALDELVARGQFETAMGVFEFGCGTGRFAERLLRDHLPPAASYLGADISGTMVRLARARLAPWSGRASVKDGDAFDLLQECRGRFDRIVSTYVLDILALDEIDSFFALAHQSLAPGGLLCVAGLTSGNTPLGSLVSQIWMLVYRIRPLLVGGCRPVDLGRRLDSVQWKLRYHAKIRRFGITSEVLVAEKI